MKVMKTKYLKCYFAVALLYLLSGSKNKNKK